MVYVLGLNKYICAVSSLEQVSSRTRHQIRSLKTIGYVNGVGDQYAPQFFGGLFFYLGFGESR